MLNEAYIKGSLTLYRTPTFLKMTCSINMRTCLRTSSFWHLTSTSSLERQETQIFLFLPLFFGFSVARFKTLASWRLHWRNCSSLTFPCFHSSWRGQQQCAWNGIANDSEVPKADKNKLYTLFVTIYKRVYNLSTLISGQINSKRWTTKDTSITKMAAVLWNKRRDLSILVSFLAHIQISPKTCKQ